MLNDGYDSTGVQTIQTITTTGSTLDSGTYYYWWPYWPNQYPVVYPTPGWVQSPSWSWSAEPTDCIGKAHVFECDHAHACKCGKIKRVMPKAKR